MYVPRIFFLISFCLQLPASGNDIECTVTPKITLRLYNYSEATQRDLDDMRLVVGQILGRSGITLRWVQCSPILGHGAFPSECGSAFGGTSFQLLLTSGTNGLRSGTLGATRGTPALTVCYRNAEKLADVGGSPVGLVLGHAAMHELGHALIGEEHHAASGIMKAAFGPQDLYDMARGWLVFEPEQRRLLRKQIALSQGCQTRQ